MQKATKKKVILVTWLVTAGDYFNTKVWSKPREEDIHNISNFLNSFPWPIGNRYIIILDEVNRGDELTGEADPSKHPGSLSYAIAVFTPKFDVSDELRVDYYKETFAIACQHGSYATTPKQKSRLSTNTCVIPIPSVLVTTTGDPFFLFREKTKFTFKN